MCIDASQWRIPNNIQLADDNFNKPHDVDLLLGAEIFFDVLQDGKYQCQGLPMLQNMRLGYIVSGTVPAVDVKGRGNSGQHAFFTYTDPLHSQLEKFWTVENLNHRLLTV